SARVPGRNHVLTRALSNLAFFFSSRRRHTRSKRDWSSDVCSSDLGHIRGCFGIGQLLVLRILIYTQDLMSPVTAWLMELDHIRRSEERRVGKEPRSRRSQRDVAKKTQATSAGGGSHSTNASKGDQA